MRALSFIVSLLLALTLIIWLISEMVFHHDPANRFNVVLMLLFIFLASGCLTALLSWAIIRRIWGEDRFTMAMRHGAWGGLFVITLPLLRWLEALSPLVIGAVLLIIFGLESLILLQKEPTGRKESIAGVDRENG